MLFRFHFILSFVAVFSPSQAHSPHTRRLPTKHNQVSENSAWHGFLPSLATRPGVLGGSDFTPLYVPDGSLGLFPTDPSAPIRWGPEGAWKDGRTDRKGAWAEIQWTGTGVEWFGTRGGSGVGASLVKVTVDGTRSESVFLKDGVEQKEQLLCRMAYLDDVQHTFRIEHDGSNGELLDVAAFVITPAMGQPKTGSNLGTRGMLRERKLKKASGQWTLEQKGQTGVAAMQLMVVDDQHAIIIDKVEHNPLSIDGHPAWGALYNLDTHETRPLDLVSNSFCAGGTFLGNGTFINVGGNPVVSDMTGAADFGDLDGLQAIRMFTPCGNGKCKIQEWPSRVRMASSRWYASVARLEDGSAMIVGGSTKGGWINNATTNNPTIEYFPSKRLPFSPQTPGVPVESSFLKQTLNSNLYPLTIVLPTPGLIFIAANNEACLYDWKTNAELPLPPFPNGVRVTYPMSGTAVLLPLDPANGYRPEVLICGGSAIDDSRAGYDIDSGEAASDQCVRMFMDEAGVKAGWAVERMPFARVMPDAVMLPDGKVLIVNGAGSGISGYGNVKNQVGQSNAANPVFQPVLYDPTAAPGARFSTAGLPASDIPRLYHSIATLTPSGKIMIAGSNPNLDRTTREYGTEYRVEWLSPPWMGAQRPRIRDVPSKMLYGATIEIDVEGIPEGAKVEVSLMDLGFVTHAVHMNSRLVRLSSTLSSGRKLTITSPPNSSVYPPGYAWLYVLADGVPSVGKRVMVGDGRGPPVDEEAIKAVLGMKGVKGGRRKKGKGGGGEGSESA